MMRLARERSRQYAQSEFQVADAVLWEFPVDHFECIVSIATLHHLPLEAMLTNMKDALRVNGVLLILDLYQESLAGAFTGGADVEFGRLVTLDEVEGGIITRFEALEQPNEHGQAEAALAHHQKLFGHPPRILAGDRGIRSPTTQHTLEEAGVKTVAIPAVGKVSAQRRAVERSPS